MYSFNHFNRSMSFMNIVCIEKYNSIIFIIALALLTSCHSIRPISKTQIKTLDGMQRIQNTTARFSIDYFGDYWFHSLSIENAINADKIFFQSLNKIGTKGALLYSGHTTLEPHCASLGILYKSNDMPEDLKQIKSDLRQRLQVENFRDTLAIVGPHSFEIISYSLQNKATRVHNQYLEYYISRENDFLRIVFWTIDSRGVEWLKIESEGIMKTLVI
jgi:hypothetical protein